MTMTGQELTQQALEVLANGSPSELVRKLRLSDVSDSQHLTKNIERWRDGKHEPPTWFVLRVLETMGMLSKLTEEEATASIERVREVLERQKLDPLEELRATVEEQGKAMTKALKALERANRDLARRLPPVVQPTKKAV